MFLVFADSAKMIPGFAFYTVTRGSVSLNIVAEYITMGGVCDLRGWLTVSLWHTTVDRSKAYRVR